jgi:hypothetical protein
MRKFTIIQIRATPQSLLRLGEKTYRFGTVVQQMELERGGFDDN